MKEETQSERFAGGCVLLEGRVICATLERRFHNEAAAVAAVEEAHAERGSAHV